LTSINVTLVGCLFDSWTNAASNIESYSILEDGHEPLTYAMLIERVRTGALLLHRRGIRRGDRVALLMPRSTNQILWILSVMSVGACVCPMEPNLPEKELHRRFKVTGICAVLYSGDACPLSVCESIVSNLCWSVDEVSLIEPTPNNGFSLGQWEADDPALLLFTSGSTGAAKGVILSQSNLLANAKGVIEHSGLNAHDRFLNVMPLYHSNSLNNQLFAPLLVGASIVLCPQFRAELIRQWLEQWKPTVVTGVPTMFNRLLRQEFSKDSWKSVRLVRCGSGPMSTAQQELIEKHLGCELLISYGLSEATCTSTMNPPGCRKIGSVGTVLARQHVTLLDENGGHVEVPGKEGEICITGPTVMSGYLTVDGVVEPVGIDGIRSGDFGFFDEDGYLFITGRLKEIIIRGGENLSPILLESALFECPGVLNACVVGAPHPDLGEVAVACVVRDPNCLVEKAAVMKFVEARLGRLYRPADILWFDAIAENSTGKVDRKGMARIVTSQWAAT